MELGVMDEQQKLKISPSLLVHWKPCITFYSSNGVLVVFFNLNLACYTIYRLNLNYI